MWRCWHVGYYLCGFLNAAAIETTVWSVGRDMIVYGFNIAWLPSIIIIYWQYKLSGAYILILKNFVPQRLKMQHQSLVLIIGNIV